MMPWVSARRHQCYGNPLLPRRSGALSGAAGIVCCPDIPATGTGPPGEALAVLGGGEANNPITARALAFSLKLFLIRFKQKFSNGSTFAERFTVRPDVL